MTSAPRVRTTYSRVAITLHWMIAVLIILNLVLGLRAASLPLYQQFQILQLHKSVGITVLVLSLGRLAWRFIGGAPPLTAEHGWERWAAIAVHSLFYVLMIGLPLSGWVIVSASPLGLPTLLYKTIPWPHIGPIHALPMATRKSVEATAASVHYALTFAAYALIALHIGAVLKHSFIDKDAVLYRMLPLRALAPKTE